MTDEAIFTRRTARLLTAAGGLTFAVTFFFLIFGETSAEIESAGADAFSRSALGYRALVELLERDVPVVVSRQRSELKASPTTPLLLLEPSALGEPLERFARMLEAVRKRRVPAVVVLPKWRGTGSTENRGWVSSVSLLPVTQPGSILRAVAGDLEAEVVRPAPEPEEPPASVPAPLRLPAPQLIRAEGLETVLGHGPDAVIVRLPDSELYVISDPDLLNTAGLAREGHASVVHDFLVGRLSPQAVVIDEVLHGYGRNESIWNALLELPLICVSLHLAAFLALGLWAGTARFGRPLEPPSRLPPGKLTLVENTARLLALSEHVKLAVERYLRLTVRRASQAAALPPEDFRRQLGRLAELGRRRGVSGDLEELARGVARLPSAGAETRRVLELSRALYRFRNGLSNRGRALPERRF